MAFVYIDNDPWFIEYESCEKLFRDLEGILNIRDLELKSSEKYVLCSSQARIRLKQFGDELHELSRKLQESSRSRLITSDEEERRRRMLELLHSKNIVINQRFQNKDPGRYLLNRQRLLNQSSSEALTKYQETPTTGWQDSDDDDDYNNDKQPLLNESTLKQQQQYLLKEQDDGLNELATIVSRQKNIAITISSEVDLQNELVDNLLVNIDRTSAGIESETKEVANILKKDSTRGLWLIIILLFIAILFVALS